MEKCMERPNCKWNGNEYHQFCKEKYGDDLEACRNACGGLGCIGKPGLSDDACNYRCPGKILFKQTQKKKTANSTHSYFFNF